MIQQIYYILDKELMVPKALMENSKILGYTMEVFIPQRKYLLIVYLHLDFQIILLLEMMEVM